MGKKVNRAIVLMMAISLLLGSVTAYAAENQEPAIEEVEGTECVIWTRTG